MVEEYIIDYLIGDRAACWSCICCGNKVDAVILGHRLISSLLLST